MTTAEPRDKTPPASAAEELFVEDGKPDVTSQGDGPTGDNVGDVSDVAAADSLDVITRGDVTGAGDAKERKPDQPTTTQPGKHPVLDRAVTSGFFIQDLGFWPLSRLLGILQQYLCCGPTAQMEMSSSTV